MGLVNAHERAKELEKAINPETAKRIVIGVGVDSKSGKVFVATSEKTARSDLKKALKPDEEFIEGVGHAESTLMKSGNMIDEVGASKSICIECEIEIRSGGAVPVSPLLDNFSRKRRKELSQDQQQALRDEVNKLRNN